MNNDGNRPIAPGPTGKFPRGKIRPDDEGGFNIAARIDREKGVIFLHLTKPVDWFALHPADARRVAAQLNGMAEALETGQPYKDTGNAD
jgi:hypothetical protein